MASQPHNMAPQRAPNCCSRFALERMDAGELPEEDSSRIRAHVATCQQCQALQRSMAQEKATFRKRWPLERFETALVTRLEQDSLPTEASASASQEGQKFERIGLRVDPEIEEETAQRFDHLRAKEPSWFTRQFAQIGPILREMIDPRWIAVTAIAAAMLVVLPQLDPEGSNPNTIRFKADVVLPGPMEVYLLRDNQVQPASTGATFHKGDRLQMVLHSGTMRFVHILSVDARGHGTWFYPQDGGTSMSILRNAEIFLPGSIELDDYRGLERLFAIYTENSIQDEQIRVAIEALVEENGLPLQLDRLESLPLEGSYQQSLLMVKE